MSKTLMILGANTLQLPLIETANAMGYDTLVISPVPSEPGHKIATYSEYIDIADEEGCLAAAKKYNICGAITDQTDIPVRTVAYVTEQLSLPGIGYETARLFTDKFLMREKCKELGIRTLSYKMCRDVEDAEYFFVSLKGKPVILKPVDNQGSKGVSKVESIEQLYKKYKEAESYSRSHTVLVEEFVTGIEFVVEGLAYDYKFKNLICGDTYYFDIPDAFSATMREFPSTRDKDLVQRVKEMNEKIITGFGLKQGISHSEFIMDGEDIILIECAARGGGVFISSDLISLGSGLETEKFLIQIATGTLKDVPETRQQDRSCCYLAMYLAGNGEVVSVEGVDEVMSRPYVHRNNLDDIRVGMRTKPIKDKTARFFLIVEGKDHDDLMERIDDIKKTMRVQVQTDEGLEGIIWE